MVATVEMHGSVVPEDVARPSGAAAERAPLPRPAQVQRLRNSLWMRIWTDAADLWDGAGTVQVGQRDILALGAASQAAKRAVSPCGGFLGSCEPSAVAAARQAWLRLSATTLSRYILYGCFPIYV